ncbi:hypothetical protein [Arsenicibacter rosenii]|uniref:Uncharacterized protein n=1 Tax=Arsenicibacter rosenii TaxID=1750698 RepID=A0A1S2VTH8_9BACT|nr:hypothetical protein [Arsenicibacter rosenii]OIN61218.1 hypothetical protein BLX24_03920 [Arsenicibacter rosenii]
MRKLFSILGSLLAVLFSCKQPAPNDWLSEHKPDHSTNARVDYESDTTISDETDYRQTARIAAGERAKLTIGYMNNETEVFRPSGYVTRLWWFSSEPALSSWQDNSAVKNRYNTPTVSIVKPTNRRSYTRKTIKSGWYIGEANESGIYYKFNVSQNSDGLLITNENSTTNPAYSGYYSGFGKLKVSLWCMVKASRLMHTLR